MKRILLATLCIGVLAACSDDKKPATAGSSGASTSAPAPTASSAASTGAFSDEPARQGFTKESGPTDLTIDATAAARVGKDSFLASVQATALSAGGFVKAQTETWTRGAETLQVTMVELESAADAKGLIQFDALATAKAGTQLDIPGVAKVIAVRTDQQARVSFARDTRVWTLIFSLGVDPQALEAVVQAQSDLG